MSEERVAAWVNLGQAARVVQMALDVRLEAAAGVSGAEFDLLWRLRSTPGGRLQMSEIAGLILASKSGVTRLVDRLVEAGLLSRETPASNRRVTYAQLTPRGQEILARAQVAFEGAFDEAFSRHLSDGDVRAVRLVLKKVLEGNGAWARDRCEPEFTGGEEHALAQEEAGEPA
ncbi:MAG: MarR family winged helix-turn-helix transcriptional regulator [Candidatus Dormibacterales bacterium]